MNRNRRRKSIVLILSLLMLLCNISVLSAEKIGHNGTRTVEANVVSLGVYFTDGDVMVECEVEAPYNVTSMDFLYILREENSVSNLVIRDTWHDSGEGNLFYNYYNCGAAVIGKEYEVSLRIGYYDADGFIEYKYFTVDSTYNGYDT